MARPGSAPRTNQKDDVSVKMDPELNAIDDLLPGPAWNSKVGNQSHNWHCKKPGESECVRFRTTEQILYAPNG